jgi:regulator of protease activity HflC (stomatin/prohibitin superfamily)
MIPAVVVAALVLLFFYSSVRVLREYERGVVFTLGRYTGTKGPGLFLLVPVLQQMVRVDLRVLVDEVPPQDVISRDNVTVKVNAVIYFRVIDAGLAVIQVRDYLQATSQLAQTTLRWVLGKHDLDSMLGERDKLNADIQDVLDKQTEAWGVKVSQVEIKRIDLDESMVRAIGRQAEAERTRRAKIINAEGEQQAAQRLVEAANILASTPQAMQLRYLATLFDIAGERTSTIVFPFPLDMMKHWMSTPPGAGSQGP